MLLNLVTLGCQLARQPCHTSHGDILIEIPLPYLGEQVAWVETFQELSWVRNIPRKPATQDIVINR